MGPGGDVHDDLGGSEGAPGAAADVAGVRHHPARSLALGALHLHDADAEDGAEVHGDAAPAAAGGAGLGVLGLDRARAVAVVTGGIALVGDAAPHASRGLLRTDRDVDDDVGPLTGPVGPGLPARRGAEGAPGIGAAGEGVAIAAARGMAGVAAGEGRSGAHGVVAAALLVVGEDGVGLGDLLEALLRVGLLVDVGVKLPGLLLEGLADLLRGGVLGHAENGVVVLVVHGCHVAGPFVRGGMRAGGGGPAGAWLGLYPWRVRSKHAGRQAYSATTTWR